MLLVCGPSYSGKSSFIKAGGADIVNFPRNFNVEFLAGFLKEKRKPKDNTVLHYSFSIDKKNAKSQINSFKTITKDLSSEKVDIAILVTPLTELKERLFLGTRHDERHTQQVAQIRQTYEHIEQNSETYLEWIHSVEESHFNIIYVKSSLGKYSLIERDQVESVIHSKITSSNTELSYEKIKSQVENHKGPAYHRVELPYGLALKGQPIWDRFPLVFKNKIKGCTLLDIGCAYGGFSFEAERRGAIVTGCDINKERLTVAREMKELLNSNVQFQLADYIYNKDLENIRFDIVLALNVLHHVPDPEKALIRLASIATKRLILEFPTSEDPLYTKDKPMKNLVGPYLMEQSGLFTKVVILPSPKKGRVYAICHTSNQKIQPQKPRDKVLLKGIPKHEIPMVA